PAPAPPAPAYAPPPAAPAYAPAPAPAPAPVPDTSQWFLGRSGQQLGPYSTADVQRMAASGQVAPGDVFWKEGMAQWLPLASIPELAARPSYPGMPGMQPYPGYPAGPSPAAVFFSSLFADTGAIIADPDAGSTRVADKKSIMYPCVWIGLQIILAGLLSLQGAPPPLLAALPENLKGIGQDTPTQLVLEDLPVLGREAERPGGDRSPYVTVAGDFDDLGRELERAAREAERAMRGGGFGGFGANRFEIFMKTMLRAIISLGILFGALMLVAAAILRTPEPLPKALAIMGLSGIPVVLVSIVAFVLGWLHSWFIGLIGAAMPAYIILFYHLFRHTTQQSGRIAILCVVSIFFGYALICGAIPAF
ncbi:MAG: DUF4339 domain-containing protein, partial [Planctomycetes bacterium]|nr:DUF4339 domain-containing protein [Planctomycetota bacterium]